MLTNYKKYELITWNVFDRHIINNDPLYLTIDNVPKYYSCEKCKTLKTDNYKRIDLDGFYEIEQLNNLPKMLEFLRLYDSYNKQINYPVNLFVLVFGNEFNQEIKYPDKIFFICYGYKFNCPINNLPPKLEYLIMGNDFNQPIENLPMSLYSLYLSKNFNQSLDYLPENIKFLNISIYYSNNLDNLPSSLRELVFNEDKYNGIFHILNICNFYEKHDDSKNIGIKLFMLSIKRNLRLFDFYDSKKHKNIYSDINYQMTKFGSVPDFNFMNYYNEKHLTTITINNLPNNLEYLYLNKNNQIINNFPEKIKYINFGREYNQNLPLDNLIKLKYIKLIVIKSMFDNIHDAKNTHKNFGIICNKFVFDLKKPENIKSDKLVVILHDKKIKYINKNIKNLSIFERLNNYLSKKN